MLVTERNENLLFFRDQVTYSHQIRDMAQVKAQSQRRTQSPQNKATKTLSALNILGKERQTVY